MLQAAARAAPCTSLRGWGRGLPPPSQSSASLSTPAGQPHSQISCAHRSQLPLAPHLMTPRLLPIGLRLPHKSQSPGCVCKHSLADIVCFCASCTCDSRAHTPRAAVCRAKGTHRLKQTEGERASTFSSEDSSGAMSLHGPHQVAQKSTNTARSACASSSPSQARTAPACADAAQLNRTRSCSPACFPASKIAKAIHYFKRQYLLTRGVIVLLTQPRTADERRPALTCNTSASKVSSVTSSSATGPWRA